MDELPHDDEEAQRAYYEKEGTDELTTTDVFQGVTKVELSAPPDEELPPPIVFLGDRKKDIEGTAPVVVYPDQHLEREALAEVSVRTTSRDLVRPSLMTAWARARSTFRPRSTRIPC